MKKFIERATYKSCYFTSMITSLQESRGIGRTLSAVALLVTGAFTLFATPSLAATAFSDNFGTGSGADNIPGWDEEGDDNSSSTRAEQGSGSGEDAASPNGGRFAKIGDGEWICANITGASGYTSLTLSYYWRGDSDGENNEYGVVEVRNGNSCTASGWTQLAQHELDDGNNNVSEPWSTLQNVAIPGSINSNNFSIRFRNAGDDGSDNNEFLRIDDVAINGTAPDTINPTVTVTQASGQVDPTLNGPILFDILFNEIVLGFTNADVSLTGSTAGGPLVVAISGSGASYTASVSGMSSAGTVVASLLAGIATDQAGNPNDASTSSDNSVQFQIDACPEEEGYQASGPCESEDVCPAVEGIQISIDECPVEPAPACSDGIDNDEDGLTDEADPGCEAEDDTSEDNPSDACPLLDGYQASVEECPVEPAPACSDGIDNDEDGLTDEADPGCEHSEDNDEFNEGEGGMCKPGSHEETIFHEAPEPYAPDQCVEGMTLVEGECVSTSDPVCEVGSYNPDTDQCEEGPQDVEEPVNAAASCESGSLDTDLDQCVVADAPTCPDGVAFSEGLCVPEGDAWSETVCVPDAQDLCPNIEDTQEEVPEGMSLDEGQCVENKRSGGGTNHHPSERKKNTGGEVLGAQTEGGSCTPLLTSFFFAGSPANDPAQVKLLDEFLAKELGIEIAVDGLYDDATVVAVNQFQLKYAAEVLAPWKALGFGDGETPTGNVFKLTQWKINSLHCGAVLPLPELP